MSVASSHYTGQLSLEQWALFRFKSDDMQRLNGKPQCLILTAHSLAFVFDVFMCLGSSSADHTRTLFHLTAPNCSPERPLLRLAESQLGVLFISASFQVGIDVCCPDLLAVSQCLEYWWWSTGGGSFFTFFPVAWGDL